MNDGETALAILRKLTDSGCIQSMGGDARTSFFIDTGNADGWTEFSETEAALLDRLALG
jgi:hypothetical protein